MSKDKKPEPPVERDIRRRLDEDTADFSEGKPGRSWDRTVSPSKPHPAEPPGNDRNRNKK
ncbi:MULTISPECIES: hypothetical protein [Methylococcus]|uniref:Uncharacterized protein n=1 Tax=Methylococcus capsulatus TaxID=414 RepID=A0ABZ2F221_METCP|nr:hypothetical protein [Methylococcus sp. BF19-07]